MTFDPVNPDPTTEFDPLVMAPTSTTVLWESSSENLASMATGGHVTNASYKLTEDGLYFASGILSTKQEILPLWTVLDVNLTQGPTQRLRKVGDLLLKLDPDGAKIYGHLNPILKSIPDPQTVRSLILRQANEVRNYWNDWRQGRAVEQRRAGAVHINNPPQSPSEPAAGSEPNDDFMAQLAKLSEMKEAGLLSEEEFTAAKARLLGQ